MVIGNGMIAKRFESYALNDEVIIFASGVSHSALAGPEDFAREEALLRETINAYPGKLLVYFGTCSVYDPSLQSSVYVTHKLAMEGLIQDNAQRFLIFRLSNPVGHTTNKHTVLNYFADHIVQHKPFTVWQNAERNLLDIDDAFTLCAYFIGKNEANAIINIANIYNYPVMDIVQALEKQLGEKALFTVVEKGNSPAIDTAHLKPLLQQLGIHFHKDYLAALLRKYFSAA